MMMFHDTITVIRPLITTDRYGSDVMDYQQGTRTEVSTVAVQPRTTTEDTTEARNQVVTGWRIYTPAGVDIDVRPTDRIEWAGRTLEVLGEVARWPHPTRPGEVHHVEFDVQKVSG